jgi:hypothetical protein
MNRAVQRYVDLVAALGAVGWAVLALYLPELNEIIDYKAGAGFGVLALGRWYAMMRALPNVKEPNPKEM